MREDENAPGWRPRHIGNWARIRLWRLKGMERRHRSVLGGIVSYTNKAGISWPGLTRIAEMANTSRSRASTAIIEIVALGLLRVVRHKRKTTRYHIVFEAWRRHPQMERLPRKKTVRESTPSGVLRKPSEYPAGGTLSTPSGVLSPSGSGGKPRIQREKTSRGSGETLKVRTAEPPEAGAVQQRTSLQDEPR